MCRAGQGLNLGKQVRQRRFRQCQPQLIIRAGENVAQTQNGLIQFLPEFIVGDDVFLHQQAQLRARDGQGLQRDTKRRLIQFRAIHAASLS